MAAAQYLDFTLILTREGDRYMAEVRDSPAGASQKVALRWPFVDQPHEVLLLKLENAVLKGRGYRGGPITSEEKVLREFGSDVFRAVFRDSEAIAAKFTGSIAIAQNATRGLRLVLRVDSPELAMLPWEYMFDTALRNAEGDYLCLRNASPVVRFLNTDAQRIPLRVEGPLRILCMIANPGSEEWVRIDAEAERHRIEEALRDIPASAVHLKWVPGGRLDDLFEMMQREPWHVFHFVGHGGTEHYLNENSEPATRGFVVMQDGAGGAVRVTESELRVTLEGDGNLRLVVLNCCDSGRGSTGFSSLGTSLVHSCVPMAVAMQFAITDDAAARFAGRFYKSLVAGQCVEQALTVARQFIRIQSNMEWGIPVLFTRTQPCVLLELDATKGATGTPPSAALPASPTPAASRAQAREELRRLFM